MSVSAASKSKLDLGAWRGWIRHGSGFPDFERTPGRGGSGLALAAGRACFDLPAAADAPRSCWERQGPIFCVFSGHLYNDRELAAELAPELSTQRFSPARFVIEAYRRWGRDAVRHIDGVYAWALWDQASETLIGSRDPVGIHPFFYAPAGEELVFSFDIETVLSHPAVSRRLDPVALAEHLTHHWSSAHDTPYRDVRSLPSGHSLTFEKRACRVEQYWQPIPLDRPMDWVGEEELSEFPRLLESSVERVLRPVNGRGGILLSGGLDSCSVAAWSRDVCESRGWRPLPAYSILFPREYSEERLQSGVAKGLGMPQTYLTVDEFSEPPGLFRRAIEHSVCSPWPAEFIYGPLFQALAERARADGCEALMSGDGGDELLTVTPAYAADMLKQGDIAGMIRMVRIFLRYWKGSAAVAVSSVFWTNSIRAIARDAIWKKAPKLAHLRHRQLLRKALPDWVAPDPAVRRELIERYDNLWGRPLSKGSFYLTQLNYGREHPLPNRTFEEQFYRNAKVGMSVLPPYWDRPLAEFLLRIHPAILNSSGQWKSLVRGAMAERFPDLGFEKQKKVVSVDRLLFRREGRPLWEWLGPRRALGELGVIDPLAYNRMLDESFEADDILKVYRTWHGATTEYWLRHRV